MSEPPKKARVRPAALAVGAGILLSRVAGFVRERAFAHYLGNSAASDAFKAALRIPNLLQNLFGEGVLSASFIPVYAKLRAQGLEEEAGRVASVVASLLTLTVAVLVAGGTLGSRLLIDAIAPGFGGEKRELTIRLVQIMFSGVGLLVLSAWCLGVLNSHKRFFLSYVAPVLWNATMIAVAVAYGSRLAGSALGQRALTERLAWGMVGGAALQLLVQLPTAIRLAGGVRPSLSLASDGARRVIRSFVPVLLSRGVVQLSAFIDQFLASFLGDGPVSAMSYAQTIYTLPVSLFGMAVSAAELPEMSSALGTAEEVATALGARLSAGLVRISFYVVPSVVAFLLLGDVVVAALFRTGRFGADDTRLVWMILGGSTVGLLASTQARLCASTFYALHEPRTPLRYAVVRVILTGALGYALALPVRQRLGWPPAWGAVGLTSSAGVAGWVEFLLLRRALVRRLGAFAIGGPATLRAWAAALVAGGVGFAVHRALPPGNPILHGVAVCALYGGLYLGVALLLGVSEARLMTERLRRR